MALNKNLVRLLKLIVSIIALLVLFSLISVEELYSTLLRFDYAFIFALLFFILFNIFLYVWSYKFILKKNIPLVETFSDYMVAWSFGLFLPGKLGELGIIPVLKKKYGIPYKFSGTAVILPKMFLFLVLIIVALFLGATLISYELIFTFALVVIICTILGYVFWSQIKKFLKKFKLLADLLNNKEKITKMLSPKNLAVMVVVAFLRFIVIIIITLISYAGFGVSAPIAAIALGAAVGQIVSFIPITINGLGAREASFSTIMTLYGVPLGATIGAVSISLILNYGLGIFIILFWNIVPVLKHKKRNHKISS
jgi:uncharacterized membrane protein YbhN (UPF0104 family)